MDISAWLINQGPLGVALVIAGLIINKFYNKIERLEKEKDDIQAASAERLSVLQEARRLDALETRKEVTSLLPGISQSLLNISDKIEISKEARRRR